MSYCRFGNDSSVYIYPHAHGYIVCGYCRLEKNFGDVLFHNYSDAIDHLQEHKKMGGKVPKYALDELKKERNELGDEIDEENSQDHKR